MVVELVAEVLGLTPYIQSNRSSAEIEDCETAVAKQQLFIELMENFTLER